MAVPKKRQSHSRSRKRWSANLQKPIKLETCPQCASARPSHTVCPNCGHYMGRTLVSTEEST